MLYRVSFLNGNPVTTVDATEFHPMVGGIIFYKDRMRTTGSNDQWGNPRRLPTRVAVAFMTNVESIVEIPEEEAIVAGPQVEQVRWVDTTMQEFGRGGTPNFVVGEMPELPPIGVDGDQVPWDAQQHD